MVPTDPFVQTRGTLATAAASVSAKVKSVTHDTIRCGIRPLMLRGRP